ncbi:hypothetical protein Q8723_19930, partial [Streptomyces cacaoi]
METAESVLGSISVEEIYELGNAWIRFGDQLHERRRAINGHLTDLGMVGDAGTAVHRAWGDADALGSTIDKAAETAWTIGQTINRYGEELYAAAEEYAKKLNAAFWSNIIGFLVGIVTLGLGPLLGPLLSMLGQVISRLIPVIAQIASRMGTVATTVAGFAGGAVAGAATTLGIDVAVGEAGAAIAGTDYDIDWGAEAWSVGLGGLLGGALGGGSAYMNKVDVGSPPPYGRGPGATGNPPAPAP